MAAKLPAKQITFWSFSRYGDYKQCPLKAKLKHLDRIQEPPNDAMARGTAIHQLAEGYLKGALPRLPRELQPMAAEFKRLRALYKKKLGGVLVEETWAFTRDWEETQWDDWLRCWLRIKLDCAHHEDATTLVVTDWKTGRFRPNEAEAMLEQLELYALGALLLHAHIQVVKPRLVFIDSGTVYPSADDVAFTRADVVRLKKLWAKRTKPMLTDKRFAPRPNDKCRWCFYRASNKDAGGGQCKF